MNCKQGDIARVVGACDPALDGNIVVCLAIETHNVEVAWLIDPPLPSADQTGVYLSLVDRVLRPIRGQEGEDEILRIAGKPQEKIHE